MSMLWLFLCLVVRFGGTESIPERFEEELLFSQLSASDLLSHFRFTIARNVTGEKELTSFHLFPKILSQIFAKYGVQELRLTFNAGRWDYERWPSDRKFVAPGGVMLLVWFAPSTETEANDRWYGLTRSLGGFLCGSLNFMDKTLTSSPQQVLRPQGHLYYPTGSPNCSECKHRVRYAVLPREAVCTENLTPYLKLLPCKHHTGLGRLLASPKRLHANTLYHTLGLHYKTRCHDRYCDARTSEVALTLTLVHRVKTLVQTRDDLLRQVFGITNSSFTHCPVSDSSVVHIQPRKLAGIQDGSTLKFGESSETLMVLSAEPRNVQLKMNAVPTEFSEYSIENASVVPLCLLPIQVNRYLTGRGTHSGGLVTVIKNTLDAAVNVTFYQSLPWYLRLQFHSMAMELNGKELNVLEFFRSIGSRYQLKPSIDREAPSVLEFTIVLPPASTFSVSISFTKALLRLSEYPPDPNRGFNIVPLVLQVEYERDMASCPDPLTHHPSDKTNMKLEIFTIGQMVMMPLPDFSMPYNVITLTCTFFSFFFSQVVSILIRRYRKTYKGNGEFSSERPIVEMLDRKSVV